MNPAAGPQGLDAGPAATLLQTDRLLLQAHRHAPSRLRPGRTDASASLGSMLGGFAWALWWAYRHAVQPTWSSGLLAAGVLFATWMAARWIAFVARPRVVDVDRLSSLLIAEALLAQQQAGRVRLEPAGGSLHAVPTGTSTPWPVDSPEALLLRARPMPVAQLVADWRGAGASTWDRLTQSARRRGVVRLLHTRRGCRVTATATGRAAAAGHQGGPLVEDCQRNDPALWRSLVSAIADGAVLAPARDAQATPAVDPRAPVGVDRFGLPGDAPPRSTATVVVVSLAIVVVAALTVARLAGAFGPDSWLGWPEWPPILGVVAALGVFASARRTWADTALPPRDSHAEEAALAQQRQRRVSRPDAPPPLPLRLLGAAAIGVLVWLLCAFVTPLGVLVCGLVIAWHGWHTRRWYRLQQLMPSPREIELAVARRSEELSAGVPAPLASAPPTKTWPAGRARPRQWLTPDQLPAPSAPVLEVFDRRRRVALQALRWHVTALALYGGSLLALATAMLGDARTPIALPLACLLTWLLCLIALPWRMAQAVHGTRFDSWQSAPGVLGRVLRAAARRLPSEGAGWLSRAGRGLRRAVAERPDPGEGGRLQPSSPLGASPRVLALATTALGLVLLGLGVAGARPPVGVAGVCMLGLTWAYGWFLRRHARRVSTEGPIGLRLVLLRVFGSPSFDDLLEWVRPWLLCGPVAHLEGYDSVQRSAEVRDAIALDRIDAALVKSPEDLAARVAALPDHRDADGRYRREAFQCTEALWRDAIGVLLARSDRVLMDLSGLGPSDLGCAYELGLVLARVPLSRVLLLVDTSTDLECLDRLLDLAEARLPADSPNAATGDATPAPWTLLRTGGLAARHAGEAHEEWLRRIDARLEPLGLAHFLLEKGSGKASTAGDAGTAAHAR